MFIQQIILRTRITVIFYASYKIALMLLFCTTHLVLVVVIKSMLPEVQLSGKHHMTLSIFCSFVSPLHCILEVNMVLFVIIDFFLTTLVTSYFAVIEASWPVTHLSMLSGPALRCVFRQEVESGAGQQVATCLVFPQ